MKKESRNGRLLKALLIGSCCLCLAIKLNGQETGIWQRERINLSGVWQSSLGECRLPGSTDENRLGDGRHSTQTTSQLTRLYPYSGQVTYERDVTIPASWAGKKVRLLMERTKPSTLWVDGDSIGSRGHIYAPHCYELPSLTPGTHHIAIRIDNSPTSVPKEIQGSHAWSDATQTNWNGILGDFCLEAREATYIEDVQVYPDIERKQAVLRLAIVGGKKGKARISVGGHAWNSPMSHELPALTREILLQEGRNDISLTIDMGDAPLLWSEFHPALYRLDISLRQGRWKDGCQTDFGMRQFSTEGTQFVLNGKKTFLRGKHDACVFPLTGYAPMDVASWRRVFQIAKQYGVNHYRCHSYTPPAAALRAADIEGIYFQIELPLWGTIDRQNTALNAFLKREGDMVLRQLGNHPSFMMLGLGNELGGDIEVMREWIEDFRRQDNRHLYCFGANNFLGWKGPQDGEDFFVTCRVGGSALYESHVRTSFAFVDAEQGGILNNTRPNAVDNYARAIASCPRPVVGHETCQFQIYPDYQQIAKYKGVLYPYNLEIFRDRLKPNGLYSQADDFSKATGRFAMACYKADIEYAFRTPGFGGFQMLDLQDYPGQGSALVGILDAFMDSKGIADPETFRGFCAPVVPLALIQDFCVRNSQELTIPIALSNYEENDWHTPLSWTLTDETGHWERNGQIPASVAQGDIATIGHITVKLNDLKTPQRLTLRLKSGTYHNYYHLWVYPDEAPESTEGIYITDKADEEMKSRLAAGERVLFLPSHDSIRQQSVGGLFTPDYWNYAMFKTISENAGKEVSPGTLSVLVDPQHPLFRHFPTEAHSNWQWWSITRNGRPFILNTTEADYRPLVQVIDNVERNHKLGLVIEACIGPGRLLMCTVNLDAVAGTPEGQQFRTALLRYMKSEQFAPSTDWTWEEWKALLTAVPNSRDITGVKNESDYAHPDKE